MKTEWLRKIIVIGFAAAVCLLLYPSFMDTLNDYTQVSVIGGYEETIEALTEEELEKLRAEADAYNEGIYEQQQIYDFYYEGEDYDDEEYDNALCITEGSSTMGYIEIPKIGVYLPIAHGAGTEDLKYMVGHMHGTSLPSGGVNTHSVLAAHTGLQNADLFTDIDELEIGDVFYIHVLGEIHVYTVDQIVVVLPGDEYEYLQIEDGMDYVTLYTCTPYGINSHRLLVRGVRTGDLTYGSTEGDMTSVNAMNIKALLLLILFILIPILILFVGLFLWPFLVKRKKKKEEEEKQKAAITEESTSEGSTEPVPEDSTPEGDTKAAPVKKKKRAFLSNLWVILLVIAVAAAVAIISYLILSSRQAEVEVETIVETAAYSYEVVVDNDSGTEAVLPEFSYGDEGVEFVSDDSHFVYSQSEGTYYVYSYEGETITAMVKYEDCGDAETAVKYLQIMTEAGAPERAGVSEMYTKNRYVVTVYDNTKWLGLKTSDLWEKYGDCVLEEE